MATAREYLDRLKEREPQIWKEPLEESPFTEQDLSEIEKGLGYTLPTSYRAFLLSYKMPKDMTVYVSFCGDSFGNSWDDTFSRDKNDYVPLPEGEIGPTVEFEWHNIQGDSGAEFLKNLKEEQENQIPCHFLEAGFIQIGEIYGRFTFLDLVNGGIVVIHPEEVYDITIFDKVDGENVQELRKAMKRQHYICKDFNDLLRLACTGDFLDEDEQKFPTKEELERDYSY